MSGNSQVYYHPSIQQIQGDSKAEEYIEVQKIVASLCWKLIHAGSTVINYITALLAHQ
jgi:hypothetical protein